jgi:hypothetical protein
VLARRCRRFSNRLLETPVGLLMNSAPENYTKEDETFGGTHDAYSLCGKDRGAAGPEQTAPEDAL